MLLLPRASAVVANRSAIAQQRWDCVVCPVLGAAAPDRPAELGVALPLEAFEPGDFGGAKLDESVHMIASGPQSAFPPLRTWSA